VFARPGCAQPDRFSWANFGGSTTIGLSTAAREDAPRRPACTRVCVPVCARTHAAACATARLSVRVYARLVGLRGGQRLSGVIESCLQGAALRCSSRALPPGEGNHNAI